MLEIKGIEKSYKIKKDKYFKVIDKINLKFSNKGFNFIVGKSGSGKSTLLNLIGGLDTYDKGDILINKTSLTNLKKKDIDAYRNTYLGFVFQDFNLIEEYTVYENVCLALDLINYKENKQEQVHKVLKEVELFDKLDNKINELSGGQKQRVAIARALVKNPQIILADEPTGNLDSETSKVIMDLLKKLSKNKLIIMVSHDTEYPRIYANRIIELKDGKLIKDSKLVKDNVIKDDFKLVHAKLKFKNIIKMSLDSIFNRKIKIAFTLLLLMTSLFFFTFSQTIINFDFGRATETTINMDDNKIFEMTNGVEVSNMIIPKNFTENEIDNLEEKYKNTNFNKSYSILGIFDLSKANSYESNIYSTKSINRAIEVATLKDLNLSILIGRNELLGENNIIISQYIADYLIKESSTLNTYLDLIDKPLLETNLVVSGIYESNHKKYEDLKNYSNTSDENFPMDLYIEWNQYKELLQSIIIKTNQYEDMIKYTDVIKVSRNNEDETFSEFIKIANKNSYDLGMSNIHIGISRYDKDYNDVSYVVKSFDDLYEGEILININLMSDLFELSNDPYIVNYDYLVNNDIIGKEIPIELLYGKGNNQSVIDTKNYKIVGVFKPDNDSIHKNSVAMIEEYQFIDYKSNDLELFVLPSTNSRDFFNFAISENYIINSPKISLINDITKGYIQAAPLLLYASIGLGIFSIMLFFNNISGSIIDKKKQIGTLRAIGTKGVDVAKIFVIEGILIGLITFILGIILLKGFIIYMNQEVYNLIGYQMQLFYLSIGVLLEVLLLTLLISFISAILPSIRIIKMKIIDAIDKR